MTGYAELQVTSNYSFLRGASHVEELMAQARLLGLPALGITDRNTLAGIARAISAPRKPASDWSWDAGSICATALSVLVYPTDRAGLCAALPAAQPRQGASGQRGLRSRLAGSRRAWRGLLSVLLPDPPDAALAESLAGAAAGGFRRPWLSRADAAPPARRCGTSARLADMAQAARVPTVATGDVLYHAPAATHPAGCGHLHPRGLHDRSGRLSARAHGGSMPEIPRRNGAALRASSGGCRAHAGDRRALPVLALRDLRYQYPEESKIRR